MRNSNFISRENYIITIIIINLFLSFSNCYLIIPLNFLPIFKNNGTAPSFIMRNLVYTKVYADIEIGTPKEYIQIPLNFESNDFYISQNPKKDFFKKPEKLDELKFYNYSNSKTCVIVEEGEYNGDNFKLSKYYKDVFYFKEEKVELEFYLPDNITEAESGGIGLEIWPLQEYTISTIDEKRSFLYKLQKNKLIGDYHWSVFYNSQNYNDKKGFLLLGLLPHELNKDLGYYNKEYFDSNYLKSIEATVWVDYIKYIFKFDEISAYKGNNKDNIIIDDNLILNSTNILKVELEYNFGGIQAPTRFQSYFNNYFKEYIINGECFSDSFISPQKYKKYFFYCKNDKNLMVKIKQNFPTFIFLKRKLNITFELNPDDLFMEINDNVYLLIYFHYTTSDGWVMGRPFLQKYQFFINPDSKLISFYSCLDKLNSNFNKNINNGIINTQLIILIIVIILSVFIILILGFCTWKYYFEAKNLRKKRANELDDEYEYSQKNDENKKEYLDAINE